MMTKIERLYREYADKMFYTAYCILGNRQDAENIVQDSFIAIIENIEKIEKNNDICCHKTWNYIVTIVKNKSFNLLKQRKRTIPSEMKEELEEADESLKNLGELVEEQELVEVLVQLVKELPYPYKDVLYLQYVNGMDGESIARLMGKSHDNIRQISLRAKKKLKRGLEARGFYGM